MTYSVSAYAMPTGAYSSSVFAEGCAGEAPAHEVWRFGVRGVNVEPGVVHTSIFENSAPATSYDKRSPYQPIMRRNGKFFAAGFRDPAQPEDGARCILEAITTSDYRLRWRVGKDAVFSPTDGAASATGVGPWAGDLRREYKRRSRILRIELRRLERL